MYHNEDREPDDFLPDYHMRWIIGCICAFNKRQDDYEISYHFVRIVKKKRGELNDKNESNSKNK